MEFLRYLTWRSRRMGAAAIVSIYNPPCAGTANTKIAAGKRSISSGRSLREGIVYQPSRPFGWARKAI